MELRTELRLKQRQRLSLSQEIRSSLHYLALTGLRLEQALADDLATNPFLTAANTHQAQEDADWLSNLAAPGPETLNAALRHLASELFWRPEDRILANLLIDECNEHGLLEIPLAAIAEDQRQDLNQLQPIQDKFLAEGGLLADNLGHSLAAQAQLKVRDGIWDPESLPPVLYLCDRLDAVARGEHVPDSEALALIKTLNPRPSSILDLDAALILPPDILIEAENGRWRISLNPLTHRAYNFDEGLLSGLTPAQKKQPDMIEFIRAAHSTVRAVAARQNTLIRLADFLCTQQDAALRRGRFHLAPLTQANAAEALQCSGSTISRAVAGKTAQTPQGVWPLRDFFTALIDPVTNLSGAQLSGKLVKAIKQENRTNPLSDSALCAAIKAEGHRVARRTLTKYRLNLGLPGAANRRRLYQSVRSPKPQMKGTV